MKRGFSGSLKVFSLVILIVVLIGAYAFFDRHNFVRKHAGYSQLRDFCSCVFVMDEDPKFCADLLGLSTDRIQIDMELQEVRMNSDRVQFATARFGCH